jgi:hypothetical protein
MNPRHAGIFARLAAHEVLSYFRRPSTSQLEANLRPSLFPTETLSDAAECELLCVTLGGVFLAPGMMTS